MLHPCSRRSWAYESRKPDANRTKLWLTPSCTCPVALLTGLGQRLDEIVPVNVVKEDVLALIATAHHVNTSKTAPANSTRIFRGMPPVFRRRDFKVNGQWRSFLRSDPRSDPIEGDSVVETNSPLTIHHGIEP